MLYIGPNKGFWNWYYNKNNGSITKRLWTKPGPKGCQVPGNMCDPNYKCFRAFDKWYKRPKKAHKLYWKLKKASGA